MSSPHTPHAACAARAALLASAVLAACASVTPAQLSLPAELSGTPPARIEVDSSGRTGRFVLGSLAGRFERRADSLQLFDSRVDAGSGSLRLAFDDGRSLLCRSRALQLNAGVLSLPARPLSVDCTLDGAAVPGRLELAERRAAAGTRSERSGHVTLGDSRLEIRSLHRLQGSALALEQPAGYALESAGRAVAALDLSDSTRPRLHRAAPDAEPTQQTAAVAAVALALLWDVAR